MSDITLTSEIAVAPVRRMDGDRAVAAEAWRTTGKDADAATDDEVRRLIRMLMRERHGSVFEFGAAHFEVFAPLFVFRQWHRHRAGWAYSEASGRWMRDGQPPPMKPVFWVPGEGRPIFKGPGHKPSAPALICGERIDRLEAVNGMAATYGACWRNYMNLLSLGVVAEVARAVLPLATYTTCGMQANPRSLMHFLGLRLGHHGSPQHEIQEAARAVELILKEGWPLTHEAWVEFGRVAP